eukprot:scaffold2460_cov109-Isochrysis_galbana.AAC.5
MGSRGRKAEVPDTEGVQVEAGPVHGPSPRADGGAVPMISPTSSPVCGLTTAAPSCGCTAAPWYCRSNPILILNRTRDGIGVLEDRRRAGLAADHLALLPNDSRGDIRRAKCERLRWVRLGGKKAAAGAMP